MSTTTGLVLRARSGFYTIATDEGDLVEARLRGRMKKERQASDLAVIGDRVTVERLPDGNAGHRLGRAAAPDASADASPDRAGRGART